MLKVRVAQYNEHRSMIRRIGSCCSIWVSALLHIYKRRYRKKLDEKCLCFFSSAAFDAIATEKKRHEKAFSSQTIKFILFMGVLKLGRTKKLLKLHSQKRF